MARVVVAGLVVLAVLWAPRPALAARTPVPASEVRAMLVQSNWTPAAIDWALATIPVYLDPDTNLNNPFHTGGQFFARFGPYHPPYVVIGRLGHPVTLDHEMHHAWDDEHEHQAESQRRADMDRLALEPTLGGAWAREVLENPAADNWHYTHFLLTKASGDPMAYPAWFRARYFGYLIQRDHRVVLPLAGG